MARGAQLVTRVISARKGRRTLSLTATSWCSCTARRMAGKILANRFTNELGNAIYARASEEPIGKTPGIVLYIAGPESDMEMHVTRQEALELYSLLSKLLKPARR